VSIRLENALESIKIVAADHRVPMREAMNQVTITVINNMENIELISDAPDDPRVVNEAVQQAVGVECSS
jgi:hypothetical protein